MYAAYRSGRNFRDPDAYIPERWLGDPQFATDERDVFHPFSYGHRNCIGKRQVNIDSS
jgi:cytochrome P450